MDHDLLAVVRNILTVLKKNPGWENKRIVYIFTGGGHRGIHTLAHAMALNDLGWFSGPFTLLAGSVGAIIASFVKQGRIGLEKAKMLFLEDAISRKVFNIFRFWRIFDTKRITDAMVKQSSGNEKYLGHKTLQNSERLYTWAMDKNAQTHLIEVKSADKPIEAIRASATMPGLDGRMVMVNGICLIDGASVNSLPLAEIVKKFDPTDVLILSNRPQKGPKSPKQSIAQKLYLMIVTWLKHCNAPMIKKLMSQDDGWKNGLKFIASNPVNSKNEKINFAFLYPSDIPVSKLLPDTQGSRELLNYALEETSYKTKTTLEFAIAYIEKEDKQWEKDLEKAINKAISQSDEEWLAEFNAAINEIVLENQNADIEENASPIEEIPIKTDETIIQEELLMQEPVDLSKTRKMSLEEMIKICDPLRERFVWAIDFTKDENGQSENTCCCDPNST